METPRKPLNKYWCSVPQQKYIKADRFRFMVYSDTGGSFNFTKTFSDDVSLDRRYVCGRRMLQQYSKQGENSSKLD